MAIKKMSVDMFDKIAKQTTLVEQDNKEDDESILTDSQIETLYEEGLSELFQINVAVTSLVTFIASSSFGFALTETGEFKDFIESMNYYTIDVIPSLLEGEINSIIEKAPPKETKEETGEFRNNLKSLRVLFFEELMQRYL